jgi:cell division septation protein DedD
MDFPRYLMLALLALVVVFGCSKKKEEAAQLEQEMLGQQDTLAATAEATVDSTALMADLTAVPDEDEYSVAAEPPGQGYTVQVAGCEDRVYAEHLVEVYSQRGYEAYVVSANVQGQTYYRVRIGAFESLAEARALETQLADRYSIDAWVDYTQ